MCGRRNILKLFSCYFLFGTSPVYAGVSEWSKEAGLGPAAVGLRGFESHPPHHARTPCIFLLSFPEEFEAVMFADILEAGFN